MIFVSTDNTVIYQLLESTGYLFTDFSMNKLMLFDQGDDCFVVLYDASSRNFTMFKATEYRQRNNTLPDLLGAIQGYEGPSFPQRMQEQAVRLIEDKLYSKDSSRFYFDAH